jgi:glycogen operon protein
MICAGDEIGRTQRGNNNAYCQDNEISWIDWELTPEQTTLLDFIRRLIAFRKEHPVLRRRKFFQGRRIRGAEVKDLAWFDPRGLEMTDEMWNAHHVRCLGVRLSGDAIDELDERGERIVDQTLLLLLNAFEGEVSFVLPAGHTTGCWGVAFETANDDMVGRCLKSGDRYELRGRSMAVLEWTDSSGEEGGARYGGR